MDMNQISSQSSLMTPELEEQIKGVFGKLEGEVTLACVIDPSDGTSVEMAELVRHISGLSIRFPASFMAGRKQRKRCRSWMLPCSQPPPCTGMGTIRGLFSTG